MEGGQAATCAPLAPRPPLQPGDKIVAISASFGEDVWAAENYGQIMYAIRTRNGTVYLKIKRNFGDMSQMEVSGRGAGAPRLGITLGMGSSTAGRLVGGGRSAATDSRYQGRSVHLQTTREQPSPSHCWPLGAAADCCPPSTSPPPLPPQ
jgi:hypothetical protein